MVLRGVHMLDGAWTEGTGASTSRPVGREESGVTGGGAQLLKASSSVDASRQQNEAPGLTEV